jgi:hypothetical protein
MCQLDMSNRFSRRHQAVHVNGVNWCHSWTDNLSAVTSLSRHTAVPITSLDAHLGAMTLVHICHGMLLMNRGDMRASSVTVGPHASGRLRRMLENVLHTRMQRTASRVLRWRSTQTTASSHSIRATKEADGGTSVRLRFCRSVIHLSMSNVRRRNGTRVSVPTRGACACARKWHRRRTTRVWTRTTHRVYLQTCFPVPRRGSIVQVARPRDRNG